MRIDYLGFVQYQKTIQKNAFLVQIGDTDSRKRVLFGTGSESYIARDMLTKAGYEITGYIDNYAPTCGKSLNGLPIWSPYQAYEQKNIRIVIAVPRQHINYVRLQLMIYHVDNYDMFLIEDFHSFSNDGVNELQNIIMEGVNTIGLEGRKVLDAMPYVQISSGLDGSKLGILNYLLYSTTWSNHIYRWLYEEYSENKGNRSINVESLEIGPGHGLLSYTWKSICQSAHVDWICFDSGDNIKRESNENYDRSLDAVKNNFGAEAFGIRKGYIESTDFGIDKKYDVVIMTEVFEHFVANPLKTMQKIANSLKEDGKLYLSTPNWGHIYMYKDWSEMPTYDEIGDEEKYLSMYAGHTYQYSKEELIDIFSKVGLTVEKYELSDANNHNFELKKRR